MKNIISLLIVSILLYSCNSDLENIDINNIDAHRQYQDSIINLDSTFTGKFFLVKKLISEYRQLDIKDLKDSASNSDYNYYLSRLYNYVDNFPLKGFWIDTLKNKFINEVEYINFNDSVYYFAEKSLELNSNNIRPMYILSVNLFTEINRWEVNRSIVPDPRPRDSVKFTNRINYIINNGLKFIKIDTSQDKQLSLGICEVGLYLLERFADVYDIKGNINTKNINGLLLVAEYCDYLKDKDPHLIIFKKKKNDIYEFVLLARKEQARLEEIARKKQARLEQIEIEKKIREEKIAREYELLENQRKAKIDG